MGQVRRGNYLCKCNRFPQKDEFFKNTNSPGHEDCFIDGYVLEKCYVEESIKKLNNEKYNLSERNVSRKNCSVCSIHTDNRGCSVDKYIIPTGNNYLKYFLWIRRVPLVLYLLTWNTAIIDSTSNLKSLLFQVKFEGINMKSQSYLTGKSFNICFLSAKDRILEAGEFIFLSYSLYLCYKMRKAPDELCQIKHITFSIVNELLFSTIYYSFRYFFITTLHPYLIFFVYFMRIHLTVSVVIFLEIGFKFSYNDSTKKVEENCCPIQNQFQIENKQTKFLSNDLNQTKEETKKDLEEFNIDITYMTNEDIRYELRKLYTQLQIYRTKTMRHDNPHISKRRGGKKQTTRKFSFQNLHSKYKQQTSKVNRNSTTPSGSVGGGTSVAGDQNSTATAAGEMDLSVKSPDDSSNSFEGVSVYMDENSYANTDILHGKGAKFLEKRTDAFKFNKNKKKLNQ